MIVPLTSLFKIDVHSFLKSEIDLGTQYKQKIYGEINQEENQTTNVTDAISVSRLKNNSIICKKKMKNSCTLFHPGWSSLQLNNPLRHQCYSE